MLAHQHGLALITEKLQNQRLEEPAGGSSGAAPSGASTSSFCGKLPAVSQDTFLIAEHPGQSTTALSVKGKNVWTLSLDTDRSNYGAHNQNDNASGPLLQASSPRNILPSVCRHKKLRHLCQICDTAPGTPSAPPKKKHCRSLSVPPDGPSTPTFFPSGKDSSASPCTRFSIGIGGHGGHSHSSHHYSHHPSSFHHHNSKIWRPIAVVPLRGSAASNNNSSSSSKSSGNSKGKERMNNNTALHPYSANFSHSSGNNDDNNNNSSSISTSVSGIYEHNTISDNVDNNNVASASSSSSRSCSSSSLLKLKLMPPSTSSSASFDSGHYTTSDLQTPPSSPIPQPRPASAASDMSYSSVGWFDFSPMRSRLNVLQNRSLSCEDRISACSSCSSSSPFSSSTTSMPCVYNSSNNNTTIVIDGGGTSAGRGGISVCCPYHSGASVGEVVPRCHSQPCVLHHRRCGKKRRRDCDRPTLNFNKMTETAYIPPHPHRKSEPWSSPSYDAQMQLWQGQGHYVFSGQQSQNPFHLNPIASSPLDTSESLIPRHLQQQQKHQLQLPSGSGIRRHGHASDRHGQRLDRMTFDLTPCDLSPKERRNQDDEEEFQEHDGKEGNDEDDEEEDDEEEDNRNCSCHQDNQRESDSVGVFPMGDLDDLDLEQIETH